MNKLANKRKQCNVTQAELASKIGVSVPYISDLEHGNRKGTFELWSRIAETLQCEVTDVVDIVMRPTIRNEA